MSQQPGINEDAYYYLFKLADSLSHAASQDRETRNSPINSRRFSFDAHMLLQAKQELDLLLTNQVTPTQSTQSLEAQLNPLPQNLVRRVFDILRLHSETIFKKKDLMDVYFYFAVVFASQEKVELDLQEGGLELILEWLRHSRLEREEKHDLGAKLLPRLIQLAFDDGIRDELKRRMLLIIVELVTDIVENRNLLTRELHPPRLGDMFLNSNDFMIQYCCTALMSILLAPNKRSRRKSADKFWPENTDEVLPSGVTGITGKSPDIIMEWMMKWGYNHGKRNWEGMITRILIGDVERRIVVGPAVGKVYLTAMVSREPPALKLMLDINFSKLQQLSIDRQAFKINVYSPPEDPAVLLDFRAISGFFEIGFADQKAMITILSYLPISLTQIQDSQINSQPTSQTTRDPVLVQSIKSASKRLYDQNPTYPPLPNCTTLRVEQTQMEDYNHGDEPFKQFEEDIYGEDLSRKQLKKDLEQLPRQTSSDLSDVSDHERPKPAPEPLATGPSRPSSVRSRKSVPIVYGRSNRFRTATPSGPRGKQPETLSRGSSTSSSTGPDTTSNSALVAAARKLASKPVETQAPEQDYFDRPPPDPMTKLPLGTTSKSQIRNQRKSEPKAVSRKRTKGVSDEEWEPTTKKARAARAASTSKTVTFKENKETAVAEKHEPKKVLNARRQSAPVKASQYGPAEGVETIQEESSAQVVKKPTSVKRASLPLSVSTGKTSGTQNTVQKEKTLSEKPLKESKSIEAEAPKDPQVGPKKDVITLTASSEDPADDEEFSDGFDYPAMDVDNYQDDLRPRSPEICPPPIVSSTRKSFLPDMPPPLLKRPNSRKFSVTAELSTTHTTETTSPAGRILTPIAITRKRSPFTETFHLSTVHEDVNPIIREHEDGRSIIKARRTEPDEESELSDNYTPTPSSRKPLPKDVELVLNSRKVAHMGDPEDLPVLHGRIGDKGKRSQKFWEGVGMSRPEPATDETRINPSDMRPSQLKMTQRPEKEAERPNGFYDRLCKAGIKLYASELLADPMDEMSDTSDSSMSDEGSDSDIGSDMGDDPPIPKHQRNIRDALREISEWMFHKFLRAEAIDLEATNRIREEYDAIFDCLTGWLNDEMVDITSSMDKDTATVLRSWEAVRVNGNKLANSMNEDKGGLKKCKAVAKFDEIQKKWG